jgi:hypothetical protein
VTKIWSDKKLESQKVGKSKRAIQNFDTQKFQKACFGMDRPNYYFLVDLKLGCWSTKSPVIKSPVKPYFGFSFPKIAKFQSQKMLNFWAEKG